MNRQFARAAVIGLATAAAVAGHAAGNAQDPLAAALGDPRRPPEQRARDAARAPVAVMRFAGVGPGARIVDLMSGGAYFTRLFSTAVGPRGRVYAVLSEEMARLCDPQEFAGTHLVEHDPSYRNVSVSVQRIDRATVPERVDLVFTAQNYHDTHVHYFEGERIADMNRAVFRMLRPGGAYVIVDHAAEPGSGSRDTERLHRIDPALIREEVTAAGFVFEGETSILRNPADDHRLGIGDPAIRGHTDQVVLRFRKPVTGSARRTS
jgi:predicted methyltransferase